MMNEPKRYCSLSLDLDNQWSYMKIHGDAGWQDFPSYLDIFIPHILEILRDMNLKITFFVVGQDAALPKHTDLLRSIVENGHEIGNHSFHHESWLHLYSREKIEHEILLAEEHIMKATRQKPIGFRGPGFSWSHDILSVLVENGYLYDASTLPTYIGPLARMYYFSKSNLSKEEREDRGDLFGRFRDGFRPVKAYLWQVSDHEKLLEIPVSTIPLFKTPFHLSYLLYLGRFSLHLMDLYLDTAIFFCRLANVEPSFLLHPLDLISGDKISELAFFPGMDISSQSKVNLFYRVLKKVQSKFDAINMSSFAEAILKRNDLKIREPHAKEAKNA